MLHFLPASLVVRGVEIDQRSDSLRLYFINEGDAGKIEQYGRSRMWDFDGPLVV